MPTETPLMKYWREVDAILAARGVRQATYGEVKSFFEVWPAQRLSPEQAAEALIKTF